MKKAKGCLKIGGVILVALLFTIFIAPYFFESQLKDQLKSELEKYVDADVEFDDISLSLWRDFPNIHITIKQPAIQGKETFKDEALFTGRSLVLSADLSWLWKRDQPMEIGKIRCVECTGNLLVLSNGHSNFDIVKTAEGDTSSQTDPNFALKRIELDNCELFYHDQSTSSVIEAEGINFLGRIDKFSNAYGLDTDMEVGALDVSFNGNRYLSEVACNFDVKAQFDEKDMSLKLEENSLSFNDFSIVALGDLKITENGQFYDLRFSSPQNEVKNLLSLIPAFYQQDFSNLKSTGNVEFSGSIRGDYLPWKNEIPGFDVALKVNNGGYRHPDLPSSIDHIDLDIQLKNTSNHLDATDLNVSKFNFSLDGAPFNGQLHLKTPISNPDFDGRMVGKIDLEKLQKAWPLPSVKSMSGIIDADIHFDANAQMIENKAFDQVALNGILDLVDILVQPASFNAISIQTAEMQFHPDRIEIPSVKMQIGKSDFKLKVILHDPLAYLSDSSVLNLEIENTSKLIDVNEWLTQTDTLNQGSPFEAIPDYLQKIRAAFRLNSDNLAYASYEFENMAIAGVWTGQNIKIDKGNARVGTSDLTVAGELQNLLSYTYHGDTLRGSLNVNAPVLNLDYFVSGESVSNSGSGSSSEVARLPERMDINLNVTSPRVIYGNWDLRKTVLEGNLGQESFEIANMSANALGGKVNFSGSYNTSTEKPTFQLKYDLENLDFKQSFSKINTFKWLAPIGRFIDGSFNNAMVLSGSLGPDLLPVIDNLDAAGFLETLDGRIRNLPSLEEIGQKFDISWFSALPLEKSKNWFEVKQGVFELKPIHYKINDVDMTISGGHALNNTMNYQVFLEIPKDKLNDSQATQWINSSWDRVLGEARNAGLSVDNNVKGKFRIDIAGPIKSPKTSFHFVGLSTGDGSGSDSTLGGSIVNQARDSINNEIGQTIHTGKDSVRKIVDTTIDSLKNTATEKITESLDSTIKNATEQVGGAVVDSIVSGLGGIVKDSSTVKNEIDNIKDILSNPFGKKKK